VQNAVSVDYMLQENGLNSNSDFKNQTLIDFSNDAVSSFTSNGNGISCTNLQDESQSTVNVNQLENGCDMNLVDFDGMVKCFSNKYHNNMKLFHLNVNSLRNKVVEIGQLLCHVDVLCLTESKLNDSFPHAQFHIDEFKIVRKDRNEHGGGIFCYIRATLPFRNRPDLSFNHNGIESVVVEIKTKSSKMMLSCIYRPPSTHIRYLHEAMNFIYGKCLSECKTVYLMGDFNVDFLKQSHALSETLVSLNLQNVVTEPTCFKNVHAPTLLDAILTNNKRCIIDTLNIDVGISDCHNLVGIAVRTHVLKRGLRVISYRSYKSFDENSYINDLIAAPFHVSEIFDEVDDKMWYHNVLLRQVIDIHAPLKTKRTRGQTTFYMNNELRKAINVKAMLRRKHRKTPSQVIWSKYKTQRNKVNKLKRQAMKSYFDKKCNDAGNKNHSKFWEAVKPYFTNKQSSRTDYISLLDDNEVVVNDQQAVCNLFNKYFVDVVSNRSEDSQVNDLDVGGVITYYSKHSSVKNIHLKLAGNNDCDVFSFHPINSQEILVKLKNLNVKKSCGYDQIPAKLVKYGANVISKTLTPIINASFQLNTFPELLKYAEVSPVFKKTDPLLRSNYRPVSVLPSLSKVFEGVICDQLNTHFEIIFDNALAAYRKHYSCEQVLLKCLEDWRKWLDNDEYIGNLMIDLSKAFDSLPHGLLLAKLHAYGLHVDACKLVYSYLTGRNQRIKLGRHRSDWQGLTRGVPQGSLLGPLLFNVFLNDYFSFINDDCTVFNYADDNTLCCHNLSSTVVKDSLENAAATSLKWFNNNYMDANPNKFQLLTLTRQKNISININVNGNIIESSDCVKLLGVLFDSNLSFNNHISSLCKKVGKQVNALCRMSRVLNTESMMNIYNSFIMSNFNYATTVWQICGKVNARKIEKLQKRALRIMFKDYDNDYVTLLNRANKATLHLQSLRKMAIMIFKIMNNMAKPLCANFFEKKVTSYNFRQQNTLVRTEKNTTKYGINSFYFQGTSLWNKLPNEFRNCKDLETFVSMLKMWSGPECACGSCLACSLHNV